MGEDQVFASSRTVAWRTGAMSQPAAFLALSGADLGKQVQAQIDTGFTGNMLIYTKAIVASRVSETAKQQGVDELFPFTDGGVTMKAVKTQREGFADSVIEAKSPFVYFPTPKVHEPDGPFDATIGNALFKNCIVTLNFHDMTLEVQRVVRGG